MEDKDGKRVDEVPHPEQPLLSRFSALSRILVPSIPVPVAIILTYYLCVDITRAIIMKLRQPTDFLILDALAATGRNVAPNLEYHTGKSRQNINSRLPVLEDYGLVEKIGPKERSGLYEITSKGNAAIALRDRYEEVDDFEVVLEQASSDHRQPSAPND
ncbi:hypothetical protein GCM10009647_080460 [Streptomyces sanglieri]